MKIIVNASNIYIGGGLQVSLSFIHELKYIKAEHEYHIFISPAIKRQVNQDLFPLNIKFYLIESSASKIFSRRNVVSCMDKLLLKINPDLVFTVFGPSYWRPKITHLSGFADGWVYNPSTIAYSRLSFFNKIKRQFLSRYKLYFLKNNSDYFVLETQDAANKLSNVAKINTNIFFVIGNTYGSVFCDNSLLDVTNEHYMKLPKRKEGEFRFLYIAHNYPSKNLSIIKLLIPLLRGFNIKFIITIDDLSFKDLFKNTIAADHIINLGPIPSISCPSVYHQCDALFAPTLLETFSAAYPESMKSGIPILTSEYSFSKDVCADAALYFNPISPKDISQKIINLVSNRKLQKKLISRGLLRLRDFETARSRAEKYIELCENIINKEKNV
jgi:glycosyltransferase involved in cell wall biosynthesis